MNVKLAAFACALLAVALSGGGATAGPTPFAMPEVTAPPHPLRLLGPGRDAFTFLRTCAQTGNRYVMATSEIPPGGGPPPHVHIWTAEWFYFPEDGFRLEVGSRRYTSLSQIPGKTAPKDTVHRIMAHRGDLYFGPSGMLHSFLNTTNRTLPIVTVWAPDDGTTAYFKAVGQPLSEQQSENPPPESRVEQSKVVLAAPKFGLIASESHDEFVSGFDTTLPPDMADNHAAELVKLLTEDGPPVKTHIPCGG
jgi:hypothetical protein